MGDINSNLSAASLTPRQGTVPRFDYKSDYAAATARLTAARTNKAFTNHPFTLDGTKYDEFQRLGPNGDILEEYTGQQRSTDPQGNVSYGNITEYHSQPGGFTTTNFFAHPQGGGTEEDRLVDANGHQTVTSNTFNAAGTPVSGDMYTPVFLPLGGYGAAPMEAKTNEVTERF